MRLYFCGAGGVGIGPLAMIASDCGWQVMGSDLYGSQMIKDLGSRGVVIKIGQQNSEHLRRLHSEAPIDCFIYSSALNESNPELVAAKELNIRAIKRADLINLIIQKKTLSMIAIAGTHGKTTTTAMIVWVLTKLNIPISYSIGSTITFGPSGKFDLGSKFFIYEADEYDKNFLNFRPALSLITNVDYDHPEIYPTRESYIAAFEQFKDQSDKVIGPLEDSDIIPGIRLNGFHNRYNASLAIKAVQSIYTESDLGELIEYIDEFPGTGRRMEKLAKNVYSDYAHTPEELAATMQMLSEMFDTEKITVVYQPHQNKRQQNIMDTGGYKDSLDLASEIYWLPTYLTRGEMESTVKTEALIENLYNSGIAKSAEMNDILLKDLAKDYRDGSVIVFFGAGSIDAWARQNLNQIVA